jgi:hypothetical protein
MGGDAFSKNVPLDHIMNLYNDTIGVDVLSDEQWERITAVTAFLRPPRQVMELLAADRKTSLDLVLCPSHISSSTARMERQRSRTLIKT